MLNFGKGAKNLRRGAGGFSVHSTTKTFKSGVVLVGTQGQQTGGGFNVGAGVKENSFARRRSTDDDDEQGGGWDLGVLSQVKDLFQECVFGAFMQAGQELMGEEDYDRRKQPIPESDKLKEGLASELCAQLWNKFGLTTQASQELVPQQMVLMYQRAVMDPQMRQALGETWNQIKGRGRGTNE